MCLGPNVGSKTRWAPNCNILLSTKLSSFRRDRSTSGPKAYTPVESEKMRPYNRRSYILVGSIEQKTFWLIQIVDVTPGMFINGGRERDRNVNTDIRGPLKSQTLSMPPAVSFQWPWSALQEAVIAYFKCSGFVACMFDHTNIKFSHI